MARIENKPSAARTQQEDVPLTKREVSKTTMIGASVGALVLFGLIGYLLTRDSPSRVSREGEIRQATPEMQQAAAGGAVAPGNPSAMSGAPAGVPAPPAPGAGDMRSMPSAP